MDKRRQPTGQFFQRLKNYSEPVKKPVSLIRKYKDSDAWLWTEVVAVVIGLAFVIPTAIALWIDLEDRQTQRIAQAWELVTRQAPGNSGKGPALEYLQSQGIELVGIDLSEESNNGRTYLEGVALNGSNFHSADLSGANLYDADLSYADLKEVNLSDANISRANFSGATLWGVNLSSASLVYTNLSNAILHFADMSGADLWGANLSGADLMKADLTGANLKEADLTGANLKEADLTGANLTGANLTDAKYLVQKRLNSACGDKETRLPDDLTIKPCVIKINKEPSR